MPKAAPDLIFDFMLAAYGGEKERLVTFLDRNPEAIDWRDDEGRTALIKSIAHGTGHPDIMGLLLARGADVNARDKQGMTPLMFAAIHNKPECLNLLLAMDADDRLRDKRGMTAADYARKLGHSHTVQALQDAVEMKQAALDAAKQLEMAGIIADAHRGTGHRVQVRKPIQYKP